MRGRLGRTGSLLIGVSIIWLASLGAVPAAAVGDDPFPSAEALATPSVAPSEVPSIAPSPSDPAPSPDLQGEDPAGGDPDPQSDGSGDDRGRRRAQTAGVDVVDDAFQPPQITVDEGTEVTWSSGGQNPHTVTADDGSFGSGTLQNGETFSTTLDTAGTFAYYCEFHGGPGGSGMSGVVVVRAAGGGGDGSPGADGTNDLPPTGRDIAAPVVMGLVLAAAGLALEVRGRRVMRHSS
jgi:plastocyanin